MRNTPQWLIVHHTGGTDKNPREDTSHHTFATVNNWHKQLWGESVKSALGFYCGYHYFIDKNGAVTKARLETEMGAHTKYYNDKSIGICLAGNFDVTKPTEQQVYALTELLKELAEAYKIPATNVVPHRRFANKTCYGKLLKDDWAASLLGAPVTETCHLGRFSTQEIVNELIARLRKL